jgi:hypothetical protein
LQVFARRHSPTIGSRSGVGLTEAVDARDVCAGLGSAFVATEPPHPAANAISTMALKDLFIGLEMHRTLTNDAKGTVLKR